jgi:hypothetical protein
MAEPGRLQRLTASDLFMLWEDYGWSSDIGGLAILDGTSLLDDDGRVDIDTVRRHLQARLHLVPRLRQLLYRPRRGSGGRCGSMLPPSTSPTTFESMRSRPPVTRSSCSRRARNWRRGGWIRPVRSGTCGCCPDCQSNGWACS